MFFIDAGSGIGMGRMFRSKQTNFHREIYVIETSAFTFGLLKTNQSNHLNNVQLFNVAISDRKGKILMNDDHVNHLANSVFTFD